MEPFLSPDRFTFDIVLLDEKNIGRGMSHA
jgi:hypothetical protein